MEDTLEVGGAISAANVSLKEHDLTELEAAAKASGVEIRGAWEKSMHE